MAPSKKSASRPLLTTPVPEMGGPKRRRYPTPLRHRKILRDSLDGITKADIRRLARRGGVRRLSGVVYHEVRGVLKLYLQKIMHSAVIYATYAKRKTVTVYDVIYALKREGRTLFGCEPLHSRPSAPRSAISGKRLSIARTNDTVETALQMVLSPPAPLGSAILAQEPAEPEPAIQEPAEPEPAEPEPAEQEHTETDIAPPFSDSLPSTPPRESQPKTVSKKKRLSRKDVPGEYGAKYP